MSFSQFDVGASIFSGGGLTSSQGTQPVDSSLPKNRTSHGVIPLTIKQISDAYDSSGDKSNVAVDGVDATHVSLLGLVLNKTEKATDVSFSLDDGTGLVNVIRWVNDIADSNEVAVIQNGIYVGVIGSLKGFQGKMQVSAFSVRPVVDYNEIPLHFIHCIQIHSENMRKKVSFPEEPPENSVNANAVLSGVKENASTASKQPPVSAVKSDSATDIYKLVLDVFEEPASLASDHGLHMDEVVRKLGIPIKKIKEAIDYHVDVGHIYSTIDDYHFKSALTS